MPEHPLSPEALRRRLYMFRRDVRARALASRPVNVAADRFGRKILHCYGDSFAVCFEHLHRRSRHLSRTIADVVYRNGATAYGINNLDSASGAGRLFRESIARLPPKSSLLFHLGEVDCGVRIWLRTMEQGTSAVDEAREAVRRYCEFLDEVSIPSSHRVIVCPAPFPRIEDLTTFTGLEGRRRTVTATIDERIDLTRQFNVMLKDGVEARGHAMLDVEHEVLDPATNRVRSDLHHPDPEDHHYRAARYSEILADALRPLGFE